MSTELGSNIIPQYTNFNVKFSSLTKDGVNLNLNTVSAWIFAMAEGSPEGTIHILKSSTGTSTSGDFIVSTGDRSVTVGVRPTEFGNRNGQFFIALTAVSSGTRITHRQKFITVEKAIATSGIP